VGERRAAVDLVADALARYDYGDAPDDVERALRLAQAQAVVDALTAEGRLVAPRRWWQL
jgi:hypothetical protein